MWLPVMPSFCSGRFIGGESGHTSLLATGFPTCRFRIEVLLFAVMVLGGQWPGHIQAADPPPELREGVQEIKLTGQVGALAVYGPDAFPVITAPQLYRDFDTTAIAAARLGKGRMVCAGHPGYLSAGSMKEGDTGRLMSNLLLWAAQVDPGQKKPLRLVFIDNKQLAESLAGSGFKVSNISQQDLETALPRCDVLLVHPSKLKKEDVPRVLDFVKQGGGLIMADAGWIWNAYTRSDEESLLEDFAGNLIARAAGIAWTSESVQGLDAMISTESPVNPLVHAAAALDFLKAHLSGNAAGKQTAQSLGSIHLTLSSIPSADELFIPILKDLCIKAGVKPLPTSKTPVSEKSTLKRLYVELETYRALQATPEMPVVSEFAAAFPGMPPESAKAVETTISVETAHPRWHSTGLYARPGDVIRVSVPENVARTARQKIRIRIGCHRDQLWKLDTWKRAPEITISVPITAAETKVTSGFGGLVYLEVPKDCELGIFETKVSGALPAPRFVLGETTNAEWKTIRNFPGPWAEIGSDKLILVLPSSAIRDFDNPAELMRFWDRVLDACADLATIPTERPFAERIVVDEQISAGYLHAGYPIMGPLSTTGELLDLKTLQSKGNWGYYHELGHNHQQPEWTWDGLTEVTVNLFSLYVLDTINPGAPYHNAIQPKNLSKMVDEFEKAGKLEGPFPQLMPYLQLRMAFGWQPFKTVFAEYRALSKDQKPKTLQERKDQWLIRFSKATNKNLAPFYDYWKFGESEEARKAVSHLPEWKWSADKKTE